jgi:myo-inositol-1(or 4)-monophosphatase
MDSKETLASNGLIHDELMRAFAKIFAGKDMDPLPAPEEWADQRS